MALASTQKMKIDSSDTIKGEEEVDTTFDCADSSHKDEATSPSSNDTSSTVDVNEGKKSSNRIHRIYRGCG